MDIFTIGKLWCQNGVISGLYQVMRAWCPLMALDGTQWVTMNQIYIFPFEKMRMY